MKSVIELTTRGIDYARFHRAYFSERFSVELVSAADLVERSFLERSPLPDGRQRIRLYIVPRVKLPGWAEKLARGFSLGYEEDTLFDPERRRAQTVVHTPGRDMLRVSADTQFIEESEGVRTRIELDLHARLPGVGGMLERFAARETEARYRIVERTLQAFVDQGRDL